MLKRLALVIVAASFLSLGCTSNKTQETGTDISEVPLDSGFSEEGGGEVVEGLDSGSDFAEDTGGDFSGDSLAPDEQLSDGAAGDAFAEGGDLGEDFGGDDLSFDAGGDEFASDLGGDTAPSADTDLGSSFGDSSGETLSEGLDSSAPLSDSLDTSANEFSPPADDAFPAPESTPAPAPMESFESDTSYSGMMGSEQETSQPTGLVGVKKIAETPFDKGGFLVNAVYIARQGDTIEGVSQKIFGSDRSADLYKINPHFSGKELKIGDKVYYNSPQRPTDRERLLTFYEDLGLAPEVYVSKPGENIRVLAKSLVGHTDGWKELYATNATDSKGDLTEGTQLRYWPNTEMAASAPPAPAPAPEPAPMETAENLPPVPEEPMATPPPMPEQAMDVPPLPEEPVSEFADNSQNMEADQGFAPPPTAGSMEPPPPPPPPPPGNMAPQQQASADGSPLAMLGEDPDQAMAIGAGAVLILAAVALFIIMVRKKKSRRPIDFSASTQTQIE